MMQNSGLSVEELYNAEVYPEDLTAVNAACAQQEDVQEEDLGPDMWESPSYVGKNRGSPDSHPCKARHQCGKCIGAGFIKHTGNRNAVGNNTAFGTGNKKRSAEAKDTEEIQMLRTKNRELVTKIGAEKEKSRKLEKEAENRKSALVAENAQLKRNDGTVAVRTGNRRG